MIVDQMEMNFIMVKELIRYQKMEDLAQVDCFCYYRKESFCFLDSTSSSSNNHRRIVAEDQEYTGDFDNEEEDEDDWKPKKKKRKNPPINIKKNKKKKEDIIVIPQPITDLDFHNCIIPLDKLW